ncbi:hypothetical protein [Nocardiopsis sp. HUAS JQ3]|uniref:hypothetical protein n=1 Tax=Nocardiopsis sp. HUAS JQ3 TaxID=3061629 RepID=UPI0023A9BB77|nr:hypothetical protein [Nocardiopsis sp. HUAS JQ3]WDZ91150.1 hypothetical protein PV789_00810 [Nocardiopsis sp. HUAS JQ3]
MTSTTTPPALPVHPRTGLTALGVLDSGRPVWPVLGGDGTGDGGDGQGGTANAGQDGDQGADGGEQGTGAQDGNDAQGAGAQDGADDLANLAPAALADMVRKLRKENGAARTNAKTTAAEEARAQLAAELGKILNPDASAEESSPEALAEQLRTAQAEAATLRTERAAERAARSAGLDPDALLDSRSFAKKLDGLDSSADTFATALDALVAEYADDSRYKAGGQAPTPSRSGGDFSGGSGDATTSDLGRLSVEDYIAKTRKKKG